MSGNSKYIAADGSTRWGSYWSIAPAIPLHHNSTWLILDDGSYVLTAIPAKEHEPKEIFALQPGERLAIDKDGKLSVERFRN